MPHNRVVMARRWQGENMSGEEVKSRCEAPDKTRKLGGDRDTWAYINRPQPNLERCISHRHNGFETTTFTYRCWCTACDVEMHRSSVEAKFCGMLSKAYGRSLPCIDREQSPGAMVCC